MNSLKTLIIIALSLLLVPGYSSGHSFGQTLKERLDQQTSFMPQPSSPVEELIAISQEYGIPMAIEWVEDQESLPLNFKTGTIRQLVAAIVGRTADHQFKVEGGMLHIFSPAAVSSPLNFLNMRIPAYEVKDESLLGAQAALRTKINMLLYPELYAEGYGGGYGAAPDDPFWRKTISFSGENLTIREILSAIAEANGHTSWVVELTKPELRGDKPAWKDVPIDRQGHSPLNHRWRFIALKQQSDSSHPPEGK